MAKQTIPSLVQIGHVGADKSMNENDTTRQVFSMASIFKHDKSFKGKLRHDIINLNYGRDFLTEDRKYDVVILHSIFYPIGYPTDTEWFKDKPQVRTSPLSTKERWIERLISTEAKYIVVCEGLPACLSGWELGEINGYDLLGIDHLIAIYRKTV